MNSETLAIETSELTKTFGATRAVDALDLAVPAGAVYGVLGPNGAGKTTAVRILATLLQPDGGHARVFGRDVAAEADAVRSQVSLTGQYASLDEDLSGAENLVLVGWLLGHTRTTARARAGQLLAAFDLADAADRQVKQYSGGMRRRLDIAASIIRRPQLLFLDEPTTGLDPRSRGQVWQLIRAIVAHGTTVLLTTQYLDEADHLAARIGVIDHGRLIAEGTPGQLKSTVGSGTLRLRLSAAAQRAEARQLLADLLDATVELDADPVVLTARLHDNGFTAARASRAITDMSERGIGVDDFALGQPTLDEVFFALTDHTNGTSEPTEQPTKESA